MGARQAVLLTPSKSSGPTQLPFYKYNASVSPLFATLTASAPVTPVFATLTQTAGVSLPPFPFWNSPLATPHSPLSPGEARHSSSLFVPISVKTQNPLLCFQSFAHSSAIRWGWGIGGPLNAIAGSLSPAPDFSPSQSTVKPAALPCYSYSSERSFIPQSSPSARSAMQSLRLNPILNTDSYKLTHWWQYPPDTRHIYSYVESRGGMFDETMLAMLQYIVKSSFAGQVFTLEDVEEARRIAHAHFGGHPKSFNY